MIELNGPFISLLGLLVTLITIMVGAFISLMVKLTNQQARIESLEEKVDDHEGQIRQLLLEIQQGVHRLELSISKITKNDKP